MKDKNRSIIVFASIFFLTVIFTTYYVFGVKVYRIMMTFIMCIEGKGKPSTSI